MRDLSIFRIVLVIGLLAAGLQACESVSEVEEKIERLQGTVVAVETSLEKGLELIETGQAIVTKVEGNSLVQTAQAVSDKLKESGLLETAQAIATKEGPALLQTVQNFATEQVPGLQETAKAVATRLPTQADIPVMKGEKTNYQASPKGVAYTINVEYRSVLDFYKQEMPAFGWERIDAASIVNKNGAIIHYKKLDRNAVVSISADPSTDYTIVQITIQDG
jgi:ABC-type Na+ efflux pump permease subunit